MCIEIAWIVLVQFSGFGDSEPTTMGYDEFLEKRKQQKVDAMLVPNIGYEPYWYDGHWVFQDPNEGKNISTTTPETVCGDDCLYLYKTVGKVCGWRSDSFNNYIPGCRPVLGLGCYGKWFDVYTPAFQTFDSYCQFLDAQCKNQDIMQRFVLVHIGACIGDQKYYYKPRGAAAHPVHRMKTFVTRFENIRPYRRPKSKNILFDKK